MARPAPTSSAARAGRASLLSPQVSAGRYFFLAPPRARAAPAAPVFGGSEACNADYLVRRPGFAYHVLEYVAAGTGTVRLDGRRHRLGTGAVFAYAPATACEIRTAPVRPLQKYFVCLDGRAVAARLARAGVAPGQARWLPAHAEIRGAFEDLIREGRHGGRLAADLSAACLEVVLLKLEDSARRAVRRGHAAEENFLRCFKSVHGVSPERLRAYRRRR
jgi:hypothetical protein